MRNLNKLSILQSLRWIAMILVLSGLLGVALAVPAPTSAAPTPSWLTFLGGSGDDQIEAMVLGKSGNLYVSGSSNASWGSPIRAYTKGSDGFVAKISPDGNLIWNTFLGGNGDDDMHHLAVDANDNLYVIGDSSANWGNPLHPYAAGSAEVPFAKLSPDGKLLWNTFFGSSGANGIVVDHAGNVLVVGVSGMSWGNPKHPYSNACHIFVAKFGTAGQLIWNTFSGGWLSPLVQVDSSDNIYVAADGAGEACGTPIVGYHDDMDTVVAKLDSNGNALWNTFIGGWGGDYFGGLDVDANGNAFVTGMSGYPWGTPISPFSDVYSGFLAQLNPNGGLMWSTFFGGTYWTSGSGIALDGDLLFLAGWTGDPHSNPGYPNQNGLALEFDLGGHELWRAVVGGGGHDSTTAIVNDHHGAFYLAGQSDAAWGTPQNAYTSKTDAFVVKFVYPTIPDTAPPKINLTKTGTDATGHKFVEMTARDTGSGIARIVAVQRDNGTMSVPKFVYGTTAPIIIRFTQIDVKKYMVVRVKVTDVAGNSAFYPPKKYPAMTVE